MARRPNTPKAGTHGIAAELAHAAWPIDQVLPYPGNARTHADAELEASLAANGQYRTIVGQASTRFVLAGNGTLAAARALGWTHVAVEWLDVDDVAARRINLVDNRLNDLAGYDLAALLALVDLADAEVAGLAGTGFDHAALAELRAQVGRAGFSDKDDVPPLPTGEPLCQLGDVWSLGDHLLLIGDATDPGRLLELVGPHQVNLVLTDPPYGVSYSKGKAGTILNDDLAERELRDLLSAAFAVWPPLMAPGAPFYVFAPSGRQQMAFRLALEHAGLDLRQQLVWVKNTFTLGRSDYQAQHEAILAGDVTDAELLGAGKDADDVLYGWAKGTHLWRGGRQQSTVWEYPKPAASRLHPTMKPVVMLERAIANSSPARGLVLDPFAGSGSTVIACHSLNRRAVLVELDPRYGDVICRRWQDHTGVYPQLAGDAEPTDFAAA